MLALIAGEGRLPAHLARSLVPGETLFCELEGYPSGLPGARAFRIEQLGSFLKTLKKEGVTEVCFAGAIRRPKVDLKKIDLATAPLVPRIAKAVKAGDDAALRAVLEVFEERGFAIRAAHEIAPDLLPEVGVIGPEPNARARADAARAAAVIEALGPLDIGQAAIVAGGQVIGVETLWGTDWMLASLAGDRRPDHGPRGGVLFKGPKPGQDRRVDLPVIGPETVARAAEAGLTGIAIAAGGVMVVDPDTVREKLEAAGLFLWVREP